MLAIRGAVATWAVALAGCALISLYGCGTPEQIDSLNWVGPTASPKGKELTPKLANRKGIAGWALISCQADENLAATNCFAIAESPQGYGFADAAEKAQAGIHTMAPGPSGNIVKPGAWFNMPVFFCPPSDTNCRERLRAQLSEFKRQANLPIYLSRVGDCPGAIKAASELMQPRFASMISARCVQIGHEQTL